MWPEKIKSNLVIGLVIAYGLIAVGLRYLSPQNDEIYPVFSWRLFADVPNTNTEYTVEITKFKGLSLEKPVVFSEAAFIESSKSVSARKLIQDFAKSYKSGVKNYQKYQTTLESVYLGNTQEYRIVQQTYNPIEKYYKTPVMKETIATFQTNVN